MSDELQPNVRVKALSGTKIEVELKETTETLFPQLPPELHGKEVPPFVLEWLLDTEEVGLMIQELLQAPTQSLCRIMPMVTDRLPSSGWFRKRDFRRTLIRRPYNRQRTQWPTPGRYTGGRDVWGFQENQEAEQIEGLPNGIQLPAELSDIVEMASRVGQWIDNGRRVRDWLESEGLADTDWLPGATGM